MKISFKENDILLIDWIDSVFDRGWTPRTETLNEIKEHGQATKHRTVGFFFHADKDFIIVAQSVSNNGEYYGKTTAERITIPLCAVKKIKKL